MEPTGGLVDGGSPITFSGVGFDAFYGRLNDTLCRWGHPAGDAVVIARPVRMDGTALVCTSAPQDAPGLGPIQIARNRGCRAKRSKPAVR